MDIFGREVLLCYVFLGLLIGTMGIDGKLKGIKNWRREEDRVRNLPGEPINVQFPQYAGYVDLGLHSQKALFYWFFEAQTEASKKPLLLWLNGGPGCSSIAFGAAQEIGPLLVGTNGTSLYRNQYSWNKVANILFLEAPVGVGFSYSNKSDDLKYPTDIKTANDSYVFLINWFKRFPEYKSREFYIAGESYAAHFVSQLAEVIYEGNQKATNKNNFINISGIMIGNGQLNDQTDDIGRVDYAWTRAIISDELHEDMMNECGFKGGEITSRCDDLYGLFWSASSNIDIYNIYAPRCPSDYSESFTKTNVPSSFTPVSRSTGTEIKYELPRDPCSGYYADTYFNRRDVQGALHANVTGLPHLYMSCSGGGVLGVWENKPVTVLPVLQKLSGNGIRIWIYSGDFDLVLSVTSTKYSINEMKLKTKEPSRVWFHGKEVGGWVTTYDGGFTFATVKGAGHMVPFDAPEKSFVLASHFLSGTPLPSTAF